MALVKLAAVLPWLDCLQQMFVAGGCRPLPHTSWMCVCITSTAAQVAVLAEIPASESREYFLDAESDELYGVYPYEYTLIVWTPW